MCRYNFHANNSPSSDVTGDSLPCVLLIDLFHRLPDGLLAVSPDGRIAHANSKAALLFGCVIGDLIGSPVADFIRLPEHGDESASEDTLAGIDTHVIDARRADGTVTVIGATNISEAGPERPYSLWQLRDLSASQVAEEKRGHAQKLEAIGRLAGGIAHDFNNLLTVITGYSQLLLDDQRHWKNGQAYIREVLTAATRAADLVRQLLAFGRRQPLTPKVFSPNAHLASLEQMLRRLIREDIELTYRLPAEVGCVLADEAQLENAMLNLLANARDALPVGGRVLIETANQWLDEDYARSRPDVSPGPYVMIAVTDNGYGMTEAVQEHLFQPFFTTKEVGKGTGLGLASVYGFVKQSGGHISVYSEINCGTTFKIYLPRADTASAISDTAKSVNTIPRGTETILLVEDDQSVREVLSAILTNCGYRVLSAGKVSEASAIMESSGSVIDLIVSDLMMPDGSGMEMIRQMRVQYPVVPVLFLSGYTDEAALALGVFDNSGVFLQKPIPPAEFAINVRRILDNSSSEPKPHGNVTQ